MQDKFMLVSKAENLSEPCRSIQRFADVVLYLLRFLHLQLVSLLIQHTHPRHHADILKSSSLGVLDCHCNTLLSTYQDSLCAHIVVLMSGDTRQQHGAGNSHEILSKRAGLLTKISDKLPSMPPAVKTKEAWNNHANRIDVLGS